MPSDVRRDGDTVEGLFIDRVAYVAMGFAGLFDLPADYQTDLNRLFVGLVYSEGSAADAERLDFILPADLPGPTQEVRVALNQAIRMAWAVRAWEERYGRGRATP